jgi:FtsP/CotA-like multicopper oxidase with cupredoxin domain
MPVPPLGRREFLGVGGGALFCTLAGHHLSLDSHVDVEKLGAQVPVPPKVAAADRGAGWTSEFVSSATSAAPTGPTRTYWIQAEPVKWQVIPTHHDAMMNRPVRGKSTFTALAYRPYAPNFAKPIGPATIPGPAIEAETGDTVIVNFRNKTKLPVTMHPHGIFYPNHMDGAYKGKFTDPGGFVRPGRTFQYVWEARPGTEGFWLYHDHGPLDPVPVFKGLFGSLIVRPAGESPPDAEFFLALHSFPPIATNLQNTFECINGRAYAGNTPTLLAKVGQKVAFRVFALDNDFHTFHVHGHRWTDADGGGVIDTKTMGPGDSLSAEWVEDNPGRWFYHCHVFSHLHMGMNGWYLVSP